MASKHIRVLKSLGQPTEYWDTLIVHLMSTKFDYSTGTGRTPSWVTAFLHGNTCLISFNIGVGLQSQSYSFWPENVKKTCFMWYMWEISSPLLLSRIQETTGSWQVEHRMTCERLWELSSSGPNSNCHRTAMCKKCGKNPNSSTSRSNTTYHGIFASRCRFISTQSTSAEQTEPNPKQ